ncbi:MAG: phosphoribosylformylglycinamidine synthase subunit PurQ [Candidatus Geothermincolia bacterium]
MKFGVVVFPGSNCDADCYNVIRDVLGQDVSYVWHGDTELAGFDCLVLPGGFSYGDYLRCGAIARFSPVMDSVRDFARAGGLVIGICNGFQILTEAGLLPGALLRNTSLRFICRYVNLRVENPGTPWTNQVTERVISLPIAHGEGNYVAEPETLRRLNEGGRVILRYCDENGETAAEANPNGSVENIAGICNETFNVFGLMPHPERASEAVLGHTDGLGMWRSIVSAWGGDA